MTEYERVTKQIAGKISPMVLGKNLFDQPIGVQEYLLDIADQILSLDGIEIKADDQSLPEGFVARLHLPHLRQVYRDETDHYLFGEKAMRKAGFIREAPKPKRK